MKKAFTVSFVKVLSSLNQRNFVGRFFILQFLLLFILIGARGQTSVTYSTPGIYSFTVPCGLTTNLKVECWGAGGGGGGGYRASGTGGSAGGGGAGGSYSVYTIPSLTVGHTYYYRIGAGGAGGTGTTAGTLTGGSGYLSAFYDSSATSGNTYYVLANGGAGGGGAPASTGTLNVNGPGGGGSTTGDIPLAAALAGGTGGTGASATDGGGGGGGAGETGAGGNAGTAPAAGAAGAGTIPGGIGGAGTAGGTATTAGTPGGGGGGDRSATTTTRAGMPGGAGQVVLTYTLLGPGVPVSLTATFITSASATLNWAAGSGAAPTSYTLQWRVSPSGTWNTVSGLTSTTYALSGLNPTTAYDFEVEALAGACTSAYSSITTFTTLCAPVSIPYTQNFDGSTAIPSCWSIIDNTGTWSVTAHAAGTLGSSPNALTFTGTAASDDWAFSPGFALTAGTSYRLTFAYGSSSANKEKFAVRYGMYQTIGSMNTTIVSLTTDAATAYTQETVDFVPATSGTYYIGILDSSGTQTAARSLFIDNFVFELTPNCLPPNTITATQITAYSAFLKWTYNAVDTLPGTGVNFEIRTNTLPGTGSLGRVDSEFFSYPMDTFSTFVDTFTEMLLAPQTTYHVYLQSNCGGGDTSAWSTVVTFTTPCAPSTLPLLQGFNATTIPSCWTQTVVTAVTAANGGPATIQFESSESEPTTVPEEGSDFVWYNSFLYDGGKNRLVSPPINTVGTSSVDLTFWWDYDYNTLYLGQDSMQVQYSLDGVTWNTVQTLQRTPPNMVSGWTQITITLPPAAGNVSQLYVGFLFISGYGDNMSMDNLNIHKTPDCQPTTGLTVTSLTPTTASLAWTAPATGTSPAGYNWQVRTSGGGGSGPTGLAASGSTTAPTVTATATGLTSGTLYNLYVQTNCGGTDTSYFWSGPYTFTTPCYPTTVPDTVTFELPTPLACWDIIDANGDGFTWGLGTTTLTGGSGTHSLEYTYDCGGNDPDDWAITQGLSLTGGTSYRLTFLYGTDFGESNSLAVSYGTVPTVSGMTTTLIPTFSFTNTTYAVNYIDFTPPATGTYYIGFLVNTPADCNGDVFIDNVDIAPSPPCIPPVVNSVTALSPTSVQVNFTCMGCSPGNSFIIEYGAPGFTPGTGATAGAGTVITGSSSPVTISGLTAATSYDVYVRQSCVAASHGYSSNSFDFNFETPCIPSSIPYTEGFETTAAFSLPSCAASTGYVDVESGAGFDVGAQAHTGTNYLDYESCFGSPEFFYTPPFNLTAGVTYQFSYWYITDGEPGWNYVAAYYGPDQSTTGAIAITGDSIANPTNTTYRQINGTFKPTTSGIYYIGIAVSAACGLNEDMSVDDISLTIPACPNPVPSNLAAGSITMTSANISFACASCTGTYYIEYGPAGFTPGTGATAGSGASLITTSSSTTVSLSGLLAGTTYDVYVRDNCSGSNFSANGYTQFTTVCPSSFPIPYTQNFDAVSVGAEPNCWTIIDGNADGTIWSVQSTGTDELTTSIPSGGSMPNAIVYSNNFTAAANDWAVTPGFAFTGGVSYRLTYLYSGDGGTQKLGVFYGTSPTATSLTSTLVASANVTATSFLSETVDFVPATTGIYYIGFKCTSAAATGEDLFVDNVKVELTPPCLTTPTAVAPTTLTPTSATITATCASCTGTYYAEYGPVGFTPTDTATHGVGSAIDTSSVLPFTLSGLTPGTTYQLYLRDNCLGGGVGFSDNSTVITFTTPCNPTGIPYSQNFDASTNIPSCWSIIDANADGDTWYVGNNGGQTGASSPNSLEYTYNSTCATGSTGNDWAVTPGFVFTGGVSYRLKFDYGNDFATDKLSVFYGTSPLASAMTNSLMAVTTFTNNGTQTDKVIDFIPATTGTYYIGFHVTSAACEDDLFVDDVVVEKTPACPTAPAGVALTFLATDSAGVSFTCASCTGIYYVEYGPTGFMPGDSSVAGTSGIIDTSSTSPVTLRGLSPATTYDVYVRDNCSLTNFSENSTVLTFTTPCLNTTLPVFQGFNSTSIPTCWSQSVVSNADGLAAFLYTPSVGSPTNDVSVSPEEGTDFVAFNSYTCESGDEMRLISPPITTTGVPSVSMSFYWFYDNSFPADGDSMYVQLSTNGTTWVTVTGLSEEVYPTGVTANGWRKINVTFPAAAGNKPTLYVGMLFKSGFGDDMDVDSVLIKASPPTATISGTGGTICAGTTVPLTIAITGTGPYSGTLSDGTHFSGTTSPITVNVTPTVATNYKIATLSDYYYSSTPAANLLDSVDITTVNPLPTAHITGATNICLGATETYTVGFTGTAPWNYTIDTAGGTIVGTTSTSPVTFVVSPYSSKTVKVSALSDANCTANYSDLDSLNITVTTGCTITWVGATSSNWNTASNWNPILVPDACSVDVLIPSGTPYSPVISTGNIQVGNLSINSPQSITLNGYNLSICKNLLGNYGVYLPGSGNLVFNGSVPQNVTGFIHTDGVVFNNTSTPVGSNVVFTNYTIMTVYRGVSLEAGNVNVTATNTSLTLLSSNVDTMAYLNDFSSGYTGTFTGNLTAERQVAVTGTAWQHMVSSPVSASFYEMVQQGNEAYGYPATDAYLIPSTNCSEDSINWQSPYSSAFTWNESNVNATTPCITTGWKTVSNADNWVAGQGYSVYLNSGSVVKLEGEPNTGNISLSGLTNSNWSFSSPPTANTPTSHTDNSGWSIVGNPYPSGLNISATSTGFDGQVQVFHPSGTYLGTYYPVQLSTTTLHLAPFQAFMVHKTSTLGTATWTFNQSGRTTNVGTSYQFYELSEYAMTIQVKGNGFADMTRLEFNAGATDGFDADYDADKFQSNQGQPTLYTVIPGYAPWGGINVMGPLAKNTTVPLGLQPGADGTFTLSFDPADLAGFPASVSIYLEDKQNPANWVNVRTSNSYTFASKAGDQAGRFALHFSPEGTSGISSTTTNANTDINIFSSANNVMVDFSRLQTVDATIQIYDVLGQQLSNEEHHTADLYSKAITSVEAAYVIVLVRMDDGQIISKKVLLTK